MKHILIISLLLCIKGSLMAAKISGEIYPTPGASTLTYNYSTIFPNDVKDDTYVTWSVTNGRILGHGTSVSLPANMGWNVNVVWEDVPTTGIVSYTYPGATETTSLVVNILSLKNVSIPYIQTNPYPNINNTISIPTTEEGTLTCTLPNIVYPTSPKKFVTDFIWKVPSGWSINVINRNTAVVSFSKGNGNGEKITVTPRGTNTAGNTTQITISRNFDGNVIDKEIYTNEEYTYTDIYIQNVNIFSGSSVSFQGYNSVKIVPEFHAAPGSYVHIFNTPPERKSTKAVTQETQIENTELNADIQAALYQNRPNPVTNETIIPCIIPETAQNACLLIFNSFGKVIQKIPVPETGHVSIPVGREGFTPGMYFYSLIIDNKTVDTKRMIIATN